MPLAGVLRTDAIVLGEDAFAELVEGQDRFALGIVERNADWLEWLLARLVAK